VGPGVGIPSFLVAFVGVLLTIYYKRNKAERARLTAAALAQNSQCSEFAVPKTFRKTHSVSRAVSDFCAPESSLCMYISKRDMSN
jgi:hypothetical protein